MALGVGRGDEVAVPSFGFSSIANAVLLRGGVPVFVDIEDTDLCIEPWAIVNSHARFCIPIHYAGVHRLPAIGVKWVEDAAHCVGSSWRLRGDFGAISFHQTKNVSCGEGGALFIRDPEMVEKVQVLRQCGTTKALVKNAWDWVSIGTQALMSEVCAEYLKTQLERCDEITKRRLEVWHVYRDRIQAKERACHAGNGHIFWFLHAERQRVIDSLPGIRLTTHYTPLHSRAPGREHGRVHGSCDVSTRVAAQILRPPMNVTPDEAERISNLINEVL